MPADEVWLQSTSSGLEVFTQRAFETQVVALVADASAVYWTLASSIKSMVMELLPCPDIALRDDRNFWMMPRD